MNGGESIVVHVELFLNGVHPASLSMRTVLDKVLRVHNLVGDDRLIIIRIAHGVLPLHGLIQHIVALLYLLVHLLLIL